jgi:hypothetical protein
MSTTPPLICGTMLVAMVSAGMAHYWSVKEFVAHYPTAPASRVMPSPVDETPQETKIQPQSLAENHSPKGYEPREEFFQELLSEVRALRSENRSLKNLEDQMAETNRDIMKMGFRLDGYSESFRPLPVQDRRDETTSFDDLPGVLPPRATPVSPLEE